MSTVYIYPSIGNGTLQSVNVTHFYKVTVSNSDTPR